MSIDCIDQHTQITVDAAIYRVDIVALDSIRMENLRKLILRLGSKTTWLGYHSYLASSGSLDSPWPRCTIPTSMSFKLKDHEIAHTLVKFY